MNQTTTLFPSHPSPGRNIVWISSVALVYFTTARFSLSLLFQPEGIAAVWPPAGLFLSAILLTRHNLRPPLVAVLLVTDFVAEMLAGTPLPVSAIYALVLAGDAVLSAWLLIRFVGEPIAFRKTRDVIGFLLLSVILSNGLMSLAAAAASTLIPGTSFWNSWTWWAASDGIGNLLFTPFILSWASRAKTAWESWTPKRMIEGAALITLLALLNFFTFGILATSHLFSLLLPYLTFPFLLWAALRFGMPGVTLALMTLAAIAVSFAAAGPAADQPGMSLDHVIDVQLYLAVMALPSLFLAAVVTEHRRMEETLRESEARFRALFEDSPIALWEEDFSKIKARFDELRRSGVTDFRTYLDANPGEVANLAAQVRVIEINQTSVRMLHAGSKEEVSRALPRYFTAESLKVFKEELIVLADGRTRFSCEAFHLTVEGKEVLFDLALAVMPGHERSLSRVLVSFVDITERKRMEEVLTERNRYIETILENSPIGFAVNTIDDGKGVFVAGRFEDIYGVPRGSLHSAAEFFEKVYLDPTFREEIRARIMADMASGDAARMHWEDIPITTAAGEKKFVTAINIPLLDQNLMVSTVQDVTARHLAEESLRHHAEELRARNEELTRFNRAATERELRMIELKREVNDLCHKAGEPPRYPLDFAESKPKG